MAMIKHDSLGLLPISLSSVDLPNGKRFYTTPEGLKYPSITTVLSELAPEVLKEWRERVGNVEADRVSGLATRRGTMIHKLFEDYLNNKTVDPRRLMPDIRFMFNKALPFLNDINTVVMQESALYSDTLRIAGRLDLAAIYKDKLSIIDFKGSGRPKERDWIKSYIAQVTGYALMFQERYNVEIEQVVIFVSVENEPPQIFTASPLEGLSYLIEAIKTYYKNNDNGLYEGPKLEGVGRTQLPL